MNSLSQGLFRRYYSHSKYTTRSLYKGYKFISVDVESLFTNIPFTKTINIILNRVYDENLIETKLKRRTLKKLISDTCKKTTFIFNNQLK